MITNNFTTEFEILLIKSYAQAKKKSPMTSISNNFLSATQNRSGFVQEFMNQFKANGGILDQEIKRGGHIDSQAIFRKVSHLVETKISSALFKSSNLMDETAFQQIVRDLKKDVRNVFYEGYLAPR